MEVSFWSQVPFKIKFANWLPTKNEKKEKKRTLQENQMYGMSRITNNFGKL